LTFLRFRNLLVAVSSFFGLTANAQYNPASLSPIRAVDVYFQRRVLLRIDLKEKLNSPLAAGLSASTYVPAEVPYRYQQGLVAGLLHAYAQLRIVGYQPDTLNQLLPYTDFLAGMKGRLDLAILGSEQDLSDFDEDDSGMGADADSFLEDPFQLYQDTSLADAENRAQPELGGARPQGGHPVDYLAKILPGLCYVVEFIEDQLFNDGCSCWQHRIRYVRLLHVSSIPGLDVRAVVAFRFDDIRHVLANMYVPEAGNDASRASMLDVLDQRRFSATILNLSGEPVYTLEQAERRRRQLLDYEQALWSF